MIRTIFHFSPDLPQFVTGQRVCEWQRVIVPDTMRSSSSPLMRVSMTMTTLLPVISTQFTSFAQQGPAQSSGFASNSFPFQSFPAVSPGPQQSFSAQSFGENSGRGFSPNPGQLEFSNFVDLPSQRLRQPAGLGGQQSLSPDCALGLPSGGCITHQDVNLAFGQAAESLPFQPLKYPATGNFSNAEIGSLGTVIHETTRILAKVCGFNIQSIEIAESFFNHHTVECRRFLKV